MTVKNKINIKTNTYFTIRVDSYGQVTVDSKGQSYIYTDVNNKVLLYVLINEDNLINCLKQMEAQYPNYIKINLALLYARIRMKDKAEFAIRLFSNRSATFSVFNIPKEKLLQFLTKLETEFNHIEYSYIIQKYNDSTSFLHNYEILLPNELKLKIEITK